MKNSNDMIGNQIHDLLDCSTVPQPTAPLYPKIVMGTLHIVKEISEYDKTIHSVLRCPIYNTH